MVFISIKRILLLLAFLLLAPLTVLAQRPEPKLQGYLAPDGSFISLEMAGGAPETLIAKYLQIYASAPTCSRVGQLYHNSATGKLGHCTATGSPGTWEYMGTGSGDVSSGASIDDNSIVRGDGGAKGIQKSLASIDDSGSVNIPAGQTYKINSVALAKGDVGLGNVDNTSDATKNAAAVALTNKTSVGSVFFFTAASDPADASAFRFGNNEFAAWEKATPGTDWTLGVNASDVLVTNAPFRALTITDDGLTAGRVPFASTGGLLQDDADLTFSVDTLTFTKGIASTNLTIGAGSAITSSGAGGALGALSFVTPGTGVAAALAVANNTAGGYSPIDGTATLTNKTINGASNTLTVRLANDISGFGTGIATALAVNTGSAGAPVLFNGALGSPSSAGTMPAFALGGTVSAGGNQINNVIIGTSTPLAGFHTTLSATSSLVTPIIGPTADSTTAIKFCAANLSTCYGAIDTTNGRWRIGSGVAPTVALDVTGGITASGDSTANNVYAGSAGYLGFNGSTLFKAAGNGGFRFSNLSESAIVTFYAPATANFQLGAAAAASPVAQTLSTQGSRSGTDSNVAGGNLTIQSGTGTGNSTGSSLIFNTPVAVASGTGAQTQTATLTLQGGNTTANGTFNAVTAIQLNGTSINTAGTLSNIAYLNANNIFTGTIQSVSAALPDIKLLDTGGNNAAFINNSADVAVIGINRDPATGTFTQTGKAAAQINLTGASSSGIIDFRVSSTNNTLPPVQMSIAGSGAITIAAPAAAGAGATYMCLSTANVINSGVTCAASYEGKGLKLNLRDVQESQALEWIRAIKPKEFDWNSDPKISGKDRAGKHDIGFSANQLDSVSPLFSVRQNGEVFSVNDRGVLSLNTTVLKNVDARVTQLEAIVAQQQKEIEVLRARQ